MDDREKPEGPSPGSAVAALDRLIVRVEADLVALRNPGKLIPFGVSAVTARLILSVEADLVVLKRARSVAVGETLKELIRSLSDEHVL